MITTKNKTMEFSIRMIYDGISYSRIEKRKFDYKNDYWCLSEIIWNSPCGFRIGSFNGKSNNIVVADFTEEGEMEKKVLFTNLEREYKLSSLDI